MGRRRGNGLFDTLVVMPWPAAIVVGVIGYAAIRWGIPAVFAKAGPIGAAFANTMGSGALSPLASLFLFVCLLTAGLSWWTAGSRAKLLDTQSSLDSIRSLSWAQIEQLVGEMFRRRGYRVEETGLGGADGGIDLVLTKDGETTLVQCKHWRTQHVGVSVVREMFGLMEHHRVAAGKIVCTGVFSTDCYRFAVGKPIELIEGEDLYRRVAEVRKDTMLMPSAPMVGATAAPVAAPACPKCRALMVERMNRTTGERFWGCPTYPACRATLAIPAR
jgi:restriction system protein